MLVRPDIFFLGEKYDGDIVRKSLYSNKGTGDIVINVDTNGYYSAVLFFYGYDPDFIAVVHIKKGYAARISQVLGKLILGAMAENKICYSLTDNKIVLKLNKNNSQGNVILETPYNHKFTITKSVGYDVSGMTELTLT